MKLLLVLCSLAVGLPLVRAADLSFAFEGDAQDRARLTSLQDAKRPPALQVSGWLNSDAHSLADLKGKIVVLDFWATWCGPCIASIPHTNELAEKYKKDVVFIGICHPKGADKMKAVVSEKGIRYPVAIDADGKTIKAYQVNSYPDYYVFDRSGALVVADCSNGQVEKVIQLLLK